MKAPAQHLLPRAGRAREAECSIASERADFYGLAACGSRGSMGAFGSSRAAARGSDRQGLGGLVFGGELRLQRVCPVPAPTVLDPYQVKTASFASSTVQSSSRTRAGLRPQRAFVMQPCSVRAGTHRAQVESRGSSSARRSPAGGERGMSVTTDLPCGHPPDRRPPIARTPTYAAHPTCSASSDGGRRAGRYGFR
jgi:hypothetical protein